MHYIYVSHGMLWAAELIHQLWTTPVKGFNLRSVLSVIWLFSFWGLAKIVCTTALSQGLWRARRDLFALILGLFVSYLPSIYADCRTKYWSTNMEKHVTLTISFSHPAENGMLIESKLHIPEVFVLLLLFNVYSMLSSSHVTTSIWEAVFRFFWSFLDIPSLLYIYFNHPNDTMS